MPPACPDGALPRPSWSAVSPCGFYFASVCLAQPRAAASAASGEQRRSSGGAAPRCRLRVWRKTGASGVAERAPPPRETSSTSSSGGWALEFQRQFLGQTLSHVAFAEASVDGAGSGRRGGASRLLVFVGSDSGMVACLDCSAGGELVFAEYLGRAAREAAQAASCEAEAQAAAAAAGGPSVSGFAVFSETRRLAVLTKDASSSSTLHLLSLPSGEVAAEALLKKPFSALAALLPPSSSCSQAQAPSKTLQSLQDTQPCVVLAASGSAGSGGSLSVWSVAQQRFVAKLAGAGGSVSALAAEGESGFVAALTRGAVSASQQQHLTIWKVESEARRGAGAAGASAKKTRVQPWTVLAPIQRIAQLLLLPLPSPAPSETETETGEQRQTAGALLLGLSEAREILIWILEQEADAEQQGAGAGPAGPRLLRILTAESATTSANSTLQQNRIEGVWFLGAAADAWRVEEKARRKLSLAQSRELSLRVFAARGDGLSPELQVALLDGLVAGGASNGQKFFLPKGALDGAAGLLAAVSPVPLEEWNEQRKAEAEDGTAAGGGEAEAAAGETNQSSEALLPVQTALASLKRGLVQQTEPEVEQDQDDDDEDQDEKDKDAAAEERLRKRRREAEKQSADRKQPPEASLRGGGGSSVGGVLRQAVATGDLPMLESVLSGAKLKKKEIANAVSDLSPSMALRLLQLLVEQHRQKPSASIFKGPWLEEVVRRHAVTLASQPEGRRQLVLLQHILQRRRRAEDALIRLKGRTELLLQCMEDQEKQQQKRRLEREEAMQPLVEFTADS